MDGGGVREGEGLGHASATGVRWATIARLVIEITAFGSAVLLARLIPPADFGRYALVIIIQELALTVTGEGIGSALVQRKDVTSEHLQGGALLCLLAAGLLTALTFVAAPLVVAPVFGHQTATLVLIASPWFLIAALTAVPSAVLRRRLAFKRLSIIDLITTIIRLAVTLGLAIAGLNAAALVFGGLIAAAIGTAALLFSVPLAYPRWRRQAIRDIMGFGLPAALAGICWTGFRNGDYAVIGARAGNASAGIYWRAYQLAVDYPRKITTIMVQVGFPVLSRTGGVEEMFAVRRRMTRMLAVIVMPLLAGLALFAPIAVPWLFGPAWTAAVVPTQILAVGGAASMLIDAIGPVLMAAGRPRALLGYGIGHFSVYVGAVFFAVPFGLTVVSIVAVAIHTVFLFVAYGWLLRGYVEHPLRSLWDDASPALVSCVPFVAVAAPIGFGLHGLGAGAAIELFSAGIVGSAAYALTLRAAFNDVWSDLVKLLGKVLPQAPQRRIAKQIAILSARFST